MTNLTKVEKKLKNMAFPKNPYRKLRLDENDVYWIDNNTLISIHLSNKPTGERNSSGQLLDNIKNEGWFLFKGGVGKMIPVRKLSKTEALNLINKR